MKLNASIRENIRNDLIKHRFEGELAKIKADKAQLADDIYDSVFDKAARALMAKLPAGWMGECKEARAYIAGTVCNITFSDKRRVPFDVAQGWGQPVAKLDGTSPLAERHLELRALEKQLKADKEAAELDINSVLLSTTSVERLREIWPDAVKFIDKHAVEPAGLPAVRIPDLNARLGLPPKAERKGGSK